MTNKQLQHYLKGGCFTATYTPKITHDLVGDNDWMIGSKITVYQNMIVSPLTSPEKYAGQHAFNSGSIYGWFPEEDISDLEIIDEFIDNPEPLPVYMYKLVFTDQNKLFPNFGKGDWKVPMVVGREFITDSDEYIMKLSKPQADEIWKCVWTGESDEVHWELMHKDNE